MRVMHEQAIIDRPARQPGHKGLRGAMHFPHPSELLRDIPWGTARCVWNELRIDFPVQHEKDNKAGCLRHTRETAAERIRECRTALGEKGSGKVDQKEE